MNFTFNNSSIVSVNSGTIVLNVSGKTRTFIDAKLVSAVEGEIVLDLPKCSIIEAGTYLVTHLIAYDAQRTFIVKSVESNYFSYYITQCEGNLKSPGFWPCGHHRYATPEEIQELNNQLASEGKCWNPDTMQIEKLRWKPNFRDVYYFIFISIDGNICKDRWNNVTVDYDRYKFGNCFPTKEEAEAKLEQIKKLLLEV